MAIVKIIDIELNASTAAKNADVLGDSVGLTVEKTKSLKTEMRELLEEIVRMERAGDTTSKKYQELTGKAGALKDQIGDLNTRFKSLGSDTKNIDGVVQGVQALSGAFAIGQAGAALFGTESEEVEKVMLKVQAAIALTTGVQSIANALQKETALSILLQTTATKAQIATQTVYTAVVGTSTGALKAFKIALVTTGVGALVVGLGLLIAAMSKSSDATLEQEAAQKALNQAITATTLLLKDEIAGINQAASVRKILAETAGASVETLRKIENEAFQERLDALKREEEFLIKAQANKNLTLEESKKLNARLIENNKEYIGEINKNELERLEAARDLAVELREAEQEAAKKAAEDARQAAKEKLEKYRELQKQILDELIQFNLALLNSDTERASKEFEAETAKNELLKLLRGQSEAERLEDEKQNSIRVLELGKATDQEIFDTKIAYDEKIRAARAASAEQDIAAAAASIDNEKLTFETRFEMLDTQQQMITNSTALSESQRTELLAENVEARQKLKDAEFSHTQKLASMTSSLLNSATEVLGKNTAAGKILGIANATISTYVSAVGAYRGMVESIPGPVGIAAGIAAAGFSVASGFKTIQKILSVKVPGGGAASAGSGPGGTESTPPTFNVVGQSGTNQLARSIGQQNQQPQKAYVVSRDMTTQQEMDRNITDTATFNG